MSSTFRVRKNKKNTFSWYSTWDSLILVPNSFFTILLSIPAKYLIFHKKYTNYKSYLSCPAAYKCLSGCSDPQSSPQQTSRQLSRRCVPNTHSSSCFQFQWPGSKSQSHPARNSLCFAARTWFEGLGLCDSAAGRQQHGVYAGLFWNSLTVRLLTPNYRDKHAMTVFCDITKALKASPPPTHWLLWRAQ